MLHPNVAIYGSPDGPAGSGLQGGWNRTRCAAACDQDPTCGVAVYSPHKTPVSSAGYCVLWAAVHTIAEAKASPGFDAYVCEAKEKGDPSGAPPHTTLPADGFFGPRAPDDASSSVPGANASTAANTSTSTNTSNSTSHMGTPESNTGCTWVAHAGTHASGYARQHTLGEFQSGPAAP